MDVRADPRVTSTGAVRSYSRSRPQGVRLRFHERSVVFDSFATGLSPRDKALVAASQRPATLGALSEPSGTPAWGTIPSWYLIGTKDKIIPPGVELTMAERAGEPAQESARGSAGRRHGRPAQPTVRKDGTDHRGH